MDTSLASRGAGYEPVETVTDAGATRFMRYCAFRHFREAGPECSDGTRSSDTEPIKLDPW